MKAISLWQPWASLWLSGRKIHETRHWHIRNQWKDWTPGQRMAVHAAKKFVKDIDPEEDLRKILDDQFGGHWAMDLPTGALIGTIAVMDCVSAGLIPDLDEDDRECGNFADGRWAWRGADPIIFPHPIPWRGSQGIFNVPDTQLPLAA